MSENANRKGSVALVTGANGGIGKEIARQLLAMGCTVYVGARDLARGRSAVTELDNAGLAGVARLVQLDVTDANSVAAAAAGIDRLDALVNNAGASPDASPAGEAGADAFRRTYETNVFGVVTVTNAFLPALRRSDHPRIVNVSSGTGSLTWSSGPNPQFDWDNGGGMAAYRSSKTALNALTVLYARSLAAEGIKVNAFAPGLRATNLNAVAAARGGDPGEAAAEGVRLATLDDDGPTGAFFSWDGTVAPW